jgi:hypothetical protein
MNSKNERQIDNGGNDDAEAMNDNNSAVFQIDDNEIDDNDFSTNRNGYDNNEYDAITNNRTSPAVLAVAVQSEDVGVSVPSVEELRIDAQLNSNSSKSAIQNRINVTTGIVDVDTKLDDNTSHRGNNRRKIFLLSSILAIAVLVLIIVGVVVIVGSNESKEKENIDDNNNQINGQNNNKENNNKENSNNPNKAENTSTGTSTFDASTRNADLNKVSDYLVSNQISGVDDLYADAITPQILAATWIAEMDDKNLAVPNGTIYSDEGYEFIVRYIMALNYFSMGGGLQTSTWENNIGFLKFIPTCDWKGMNKNFQFTGIICSEIRSTETNSSMVNVPTEIYLGMSFYFEQMHDTYITNNYCY